MDTIKVREAKKGDCVQIFQLMKEKFSGDPEFRMTLEGNGLIISVKWNIHKNTYVF